MEGMGLMVILTITVTATTLTVTMEEVVLAENIALKVILTEKVSDVHAVEHLTLAQAGKVLTVAGVVVKEAVGAAAVAVGAAVVTVVDVVDKKRDGAFRFRPLKQRNT
jgi:hypothetical protein